MNIHIPLNYGLTEKQLRANKAVDREIFERAMVMFNTKAPEVYANLRTSTGYSDPKLDTLFSGFCIAQNMARGVIKSPLIEPEPAPLEPGQSTLPIHRCTSIYWGETEFKSPGRQDTGVSIGYVRAHGKLWPKAWDGDTIIYDDHTGEHGNAGADYIDVVALPHFGMSDKGMADFTETLQAAKDYIVGIMNNQHVHVKTLQEIPLANSDKVRTAWLVRLTVTHEEFMSDQIQLRSH